MAQVLIVCATRTGETRRIGELIGEGVRFAGHEARVVDVQEIKRAEDLAGYAGYVFGSPTYHGEMLQAMKTFLFLAEKAGLEGKVGGAFGAHGWSTEAQDRIYETMKTVFGMAMAGGGPLPLKSSALGGGMSMAQDYGRQIAARLT